MRYSGVSTIARPPPARLSRYPELYTAVCLHPLFRKRLLTAHTQADCRGGCRAVVPARAPRPILLTLFADAPTGAQKSVAMCLMLERGVSKRPRSVRRGQ